MTFPTLFPVQHEICNGFTENDDGNTVPTYGAPTDLKAIAYGPHSASNWSQAETRADTTYLETIDLDLFLPPTTVNLKDLFIVEDVTYEVVDVADWTHGFHNFKPGVVVALKKWMG